METASDLSVPVNNLAPIRIALLGGERVGKTSILSKLSQGVYADTYYPTYRTNSDLFTFAPDSLATRAILDTEKVYTPRPNQEVVLSPALLLRKPLRSRPEAALVPDVVVTGSNDFYHSYRRKLEAAGPPHITPVLVEIVDTPAFNPDMFVPFLETSLYMNLGKDVLRNLANDERRPVSTNPLLVASGSGELNGSIDGYFFVYSAVPSMSPPSYDSAVSEPQPPQADRNLSLLPTIKLALDDAWKEFFTFKQMWDQGKEDDIYSLKTALKNVFQLKTALEMEIQRQNKRKLYTQLVDISADPLAPNSPPPVWIVCTNVRSPLRSPQLVEAGKHFAREWKYGFVAIDVAHDDDIEIAVALMVRELAQRRLLQRRRK